MSQVTLTTSYCQCKEGYQPLVQPDYILCVQGDFIVMFNPGNFTNPDWSSEVDQPAVPDLPGQSLYSPAPPRFPSLFYLQTLLQDEMAAEVIKTK